MVSDSGEHKKGLGQRGVRLLLAMFIALFLYSYIGKKEI